MFPHRWYPDQVSSLQYGVGSRYPVVNQHTGLPVSGPDLTDDELIANENNFTANTDAHPLDDGFYHDRGADLSKITAPLLSCGNWGGQHLHLRGNIEASLRLFPAEVSPARPLPATAISGCFLSPALPRPEESCLKPPAIT